jgi:hypothetical protein
MPGAAVFAPREVMERIRGDGVFGSILSDEMGLNVPPARHREEAHCNLVECEQRGPVSL